MKKGVSNMSDQEKKTTEKEQQGKERTGHAKSTQKKRRPNPEHPSTVEHKKKKTTGTAQKEPARKSARQIMKLEKQWEKSTRRLIRQAEKSTKHQLKFLSRLSGIWMILGYLCLTIWEKRERN